MLPLIDNKEEAAIKAATEKLDRFPEQYDAIWTSSFCSKIGLLDQKENDVDLIKGLLECMSENNADFSLTFRQLSKMLQEEDRNNGLLDEQFTSLFEDQSAAVGWLVQWRQRLRHENRSDLERQKAMQAINPAYIPRNHRIEEIIMAALDGDYAPFEKLNDILLHPFEEQIENIEYQRPPLQEEIVNETFCGT
jgi:uncharacterized protein YdiU (UPF0061 family)